VNDVKAALAHYLVYRPSAFHNGCGVFFVKRQGQVANARLAQSADVLAARRSHANKLSHRAQGARKGQHVRFGTADAHSCGAYQNLH
jgi:hypothetical protein